MTNLPSPAVEQEQKPFASNTDWIRSCERILVKKLGNNRAGQNLQKEADCETIREMEVYSSADRVLMNIQKKHSWQLPDSAVTSLKLDVWRGL